jgi:hypothetical protein
MSPAATRSASPAGDGRLGDAYIFARTVALDVSARRTALGGPAN